MKRTLEDIRDNLEWVGCDNETVLELCAEVERLREYRDHHEFVLSQIEALTRVKISTIDDVLAEIKGLNAVVAKLTRDCNSLEDDVRYNGEALARANEMKGEIDRLRAIVDRLPKTADGVPIAPGDTLYDRYRALAFNITGFNTSDGMLSCLYGAGGFDAICSGYYSTREDAEKARKP
jgi:outer membrane murein-binding lipoprotein Lpp